MINTYDPHFFASAIEEINAHIMSRAAKKDKTVTMTAEMFQMLQGIEKKATIMSTCAKKQKKLAMPAKKRKRTCPYAVPEFKTKIGGGVDPF